MTTLDGIDLPLELFAEGKVRNIYTIPDAEDRLLFVASDRVSCFDVVLNTPIPHKGHLLTALTAFWLPLLQFSLPELQTHFISLELPPAALKPRIESESDADRAEEAKRRRGIEKAYAGRSMVVRKLEMLKIESIVRGYLTGSAWTEYQTTHTIHSHPLPPGLLEAQKLPTPLWTPSTKAPPGSKDENITPSAAASIIGHDLAAQVETLSLSIYELAAAHALSKGIIIADTKLEFGVDRSTDPPTVVLADEVLTPDSSRFWRSEEYEVGRAQRSLDKQGLRDWLAREGLKGKEGVDVPTEVVEGTMRGYEEAFERLVGRTFEGGREDA
ncbi:MAG: Bifunctional purine biosynthetic protein ade1 [Chrysothrix sp. TS-e1954]|nr:MAG: Bifunctional purine biosynthetic protein ade1 [Chrysothrix sp. TS-e1954]